MARVIGASGNHPFLVLRDERRPGRQRARYRTTLGRRRGPPGRRLRRRAPPTFPSSVAPPRSAARHVHRTLGFTNPDLCWFLGLFVGDGYIHRSRRATCRSSSPSTPTDEGLIAEISRVGARAVRARLPLAADGQRLTARATACARRVPRAQRPRRHDRTTKRLPDWVARPPDSTSAWPSSPGSSTPTAPCGPTIRRRTRSSRVATHSCSSDLRELALLCGIGVSRVGRVREPAPARPLERVIVGYRLHLSGRFDRLPLRSPREGRPARCRAATPTRSAPPTGTTFRAHTSEMLGFVRIDSDRVRRRRAHVRHRGRRPPQLRRRGLRRPQLRSRLPPQPGGPGGAGNPVLRHGHRAARVPGPGQAVLRHGDPAR